MSKTIGIIGPSIEDNESYLGMIEEEGQIYYHHIINEYDLKGRSFDEVLEHPRAKINPFYKKIKAALPMHMKVPTPIQTNEFSSSDLIDIVRDFNTMIIATDTRGLKGQDAKRWVLDWISKKK